MERPSLTRRPVRRKDGRIILHFDYDCFYASVFENRNPALKAQPLGVKQKSILATCNYVARARGVKKLMLISEAKKICPELVLVDGENLTPFRDMSKTLYAFLRSSSWSGKVERLGFDEVFMDVTDIIDYNMECLNKACLSDSFFYLSNVNPEEGFVCDLTTVAGPSHGTAPSDIVADDPAHLRLVLASHLARHLRLKLEHDFGFTSTCGISTNKLLSKLAGGVHKPRNQTTLLAFNDEDILAFLDPLAIRKIPGIGAKTTHLLESHLLRKTGENQDPYNLDSVLTTHDVRTHPRVTPDVLERLLGGPGAEKGIGARVWGLLHGIDDTQVKEATDVPSQISIEDTYRDLSDVNQIKRELRKLAASLLRRMRIDLLVDDEHAEEPGRQRWIAHPKTLRLSVANRPVDEVGGFGFARKSRSQPLAGFVFSLEDGVPEIANRLAEEALEPMLLRLGPDPEPGWNLSLINICVANMTLSGSNERGGIGRDIGVMFRKQDEVLRQWRVETATLEDADQAVPSEGDIGLDDSDSEQSWGDDGSAVACPRCGHAIPLFAAPAHARYHEMGD